jgi:hypothetical protein
VSWLWLAAALALPIRAHGQVGSAEPTSIPVGLSTHRPVVEWGVTERPSLASNRNTRAAQTTQDGGVDQGNGKVDVRGLSGTLNKDDVHQTMDARQRALNACTERARQSHSAGLGWVGGQMRFAFKVDAEGKIASLRPTLSSLGHYELEQCLTEVVRETRFPKPSGRATADFSWGMKVEPANSHAPATLRASAIASSVRKHRSEIRKQCALPRRTRLRVTAYVSTSGQVLSSGATSSPPAAQQAVPCVLEQLSKWHLPKQKRVTKVSFGLP